MAQFVRTCPGDVAARRARRMHPVVLPSRVFDWIDMLFNAGHYTCSVAGMNKLSISPSEWAIMEALWEASPKTASEVCRALRPNSNWAENTVRTLLTRLVEKKALKVGKNESGTRTFRPAVSRDAIVKAESDSFAQRLFGGAAKPLITHFVQNSELTAEDVAELKRILDESLKS